MTYDMHNTDKINVYRQDLERANIPLFPPDLNCSDVEYTVEGNAVRYALAAIKNVGAQAMETVILERKTNGPYKTLSDLAARLDPSRDVCDLIQLALLTGARRANLLAMRWDQISLDTMVWRIPETKNGTPAEAVKAPKEARAPKEPKAPREGKAAKEGKTPREGKAPREGKGKGAQEAAAEKPKGKRQPDPPGYKPRLKKMYLETVVKDLREEFSYKTPMQVPRLSKIVVSMGIGEAIANKKLLDSASQEIQQITGRKPVRTKAKKSIANFKVRKDMDLGIMVTLRGNVMYEFLDRLVNVAMPRIKDFRGANPNAFDGHGNFSLGVTEQIIFPEIDYDKVEMVHGLDVIICTSAKTDKESKSLLRFFGMPFRN